MKKIFSFVIVMLSISCTNIDSIDKHNQFLTVTNKDLENLDTLNAIIFRNKDKINPNFEKALKGHDSVQYQKSYKDFENSLDDQKNKKFELFTSDLNTTDSIVVYQIKMDSYNKTKIFHSLVFQASLPQNGIQKDSKIVLTKILNLHWTYNIIND